jgi:YD repeat-containing protein
MTDLATARAFRHLAHALAACLAFGLISSTTAAIAAAMGAEEAVSQLHANAPSTGHGQSATLLPDGRWLLLGGEGPDQRATREGLFIDAASGDPIGEPIAMTTARSGHTATLLPNGEILIVGGVGNDGRHVTQAETLDYETGTSALATTLELLPRAFHTATLLTDGRVLIAGGIGADGEVLDDAEVLDPLDNRVERFNARLETARFGHLAALLPSAPVLVWGGRDQTNQPLATGELFDPETGRFSLLNPQSSNLLPQVGDEGALPVVVASIPEHGARNVPVDQILSVRFSKPLRVETLDERSVTLLGPTGVVPVDVVPAETGLLVFVTPTQQLLPSSAYTLFMRGATDTNATSLPFTALGFRTAAIPAASSVPGAATTNPGPTGPTVPTTATQGQNTETGNSRSHPSAPTGAPDPLQSTKVGSDTTAGQSIAEPDEEWNPGPLQYSTGAWYTDRPLPPHADPKKALKLQAAPGITAISGLVLKLNDRPLPGATLRMGQKSARTNADGSFLIEGVLPGQQTLVIDAATAGADYGFFEAVVFIEPGKTNIVPFTIWIPKLDRQNAVRIPSPTLTEVVLTTPKMPGFAVVIPPGVVIRDRAGKIVTELGITPIPVDRTPFPLPIIFEFNTYYTIQPAGAVLQSLDGKPVQARVIYPNYANVARGKRMLFWNHDPAERGWHVYGEGKVSDDRKNVVPDANVGVYQFSGFMVSVPGTPPPSPCPCPAPDGGGSGGGGNSATPGVPFDGDPVNLATGQFVYSHTDLVVNDIVPLKLRRIYINNDYGGSSRPFGLNMMAGIDYLLYNPNPVWLLTGPVHLYLTPPDGSSIDLLCVQSCSYATTGVFEVQTPGYFYKGVMTYQAGDWILTTRDGTRYVFTTNGGQIKYFADRYGNKTTFLRNPSVTGNLSAVISPSGRSIEFTYDNSETRITAARDNSGRTWTYAYTNGQMTSATDPMGGTWNYTYDSTLSAIPMKTVTDPRGNTVVTNEWINGRLTQTYADGSTTSFAMTGGSPVTQIDVTDRRGNVRRVVFNPAYYVSSDTFALGTPESQTTTFSRDPTTKLLLSRTDPLGRVTSYTYDAKGNMLTRTLLAGTSNAVTTTYTYESTFNQVATVTDPLGHVATYTYDTQGNIVQVVDANNNATTATYTPQGRVATITDPLNHTINFSYDAGILTSITDGIGRTTAMFLDTLGRTVATRDPQGNVASTDYDALDRMTRTVDPLGNAVQFAYDPNGNLLSYTDQRGGSYVYSYDVMNRITGRKDALLNTAAYAYDVASMPRQFTDRRGQVSGFTYDALNRRIRNGFGATLASPEAFESTISYSFDSGNRLVQAADSQNGTIIRSYDLLSRLVQEQTSQGTVSYSYDAAGRRTSMTVTGQPVVTYTYDNSNRLLQIQQGSQTVGFAYDASNRRTQTVLPNGVTINYGYDNANQLTAITYTKGPNTLGDLSYAYDASGRRIGFGGSFARTILPATVASGSYNVNNQLMQWVGQARVYDPNGNLTSDGRGGSGN